MKRRHWPPVGAQVRRLQDHPSQPSRRQWRRLGYAVAPWSGKIAVLVTSLDENHYSDRCDSPPLSCERADCENVFDELKNHWGWNGFTTLLATYLPYSSASFRPSLIAKDVTEARTASSA